MALKPVTDPNLLTALNSAPAPAAPAGPKPVTDPAVLAQLNGPPALEDTVPGSPEEAAAKAAMPAPPVQEETGLWDRVKNAQTGDPIIDMWLSGLPKIVKGAPEVAMNTIGNTGVQAVAGLTAPMVATDDNDQADFVRDFTAENSMYPQGESAQELTAALGDAFTPMQNIKSKLGDTTLDATGSPGLATAADMLPDFLAALAGGTPAVKGAAAAPRIPLKAEPVINPMVGNLRDADIRLRPSDVRAMAPGAKKVPGEFREKFADGPELKKDMTLHNQQRLTSVVAKDLGIEKLDEASFAKAKEAPTATYDMVESVLMDRDMSPDFVSTFREAAASAKLPKGEKMSVTRVIGALRRRAAKRMQSDQVATEEAGFADRELADRLEEQLGKELEAVGEPQLLQEYRDARQQFAKVHDAETATRAEQIDAATLLKLKKRGAPLSGGLKLAADASEYAPNVTQHSLKTAAREGDQLEGSREGLIKRGIKTAARAIPGVDVGKPGFQEKFGVPNEARAASYGRPSEITPERTRTQAELDLREPLGLEPPPGEVGVALPSFMRDRAKPTSGPQTDMLGEAFEFDMPPGEVGVPPPEQISLQELLGLGEPLQMKQPPGRVGKPKRKP